MQNYFLSSLMHSSFISSYSLIFSLFRVPRLSLIISPKSSILRLLNSEYIAKEFLTLAGDILKLVNSVNAVLLAFFFWLNFSLTQPTNLTICSFSSSRKLKLGYSRIILLSCIAYIKPVFLFPRITTLNPDALSRSARC